MSDIQEKDPVRTGIFGIAVVSMLVLVAFGYTGLPFWPQGKQYTGYFADSGGLESGGNVFVSGIKVGQVKDVSLAGNKVRVDFTVDRSIRLGDQSLAAIRTTTVLGEKSLSVTPAGAGRITEIPLGRTTTPYTLNSALSDLGASAGGIDKAQLDQSLQVITEAMRDATPQLRGALDGVASLSRTLNARDAALEQLLTHAKSVSGILSERAGQVNKLVTDGNQLFAALDERRLAISELINRIQGLSQQISGFVADNRQEFRPTMEKLSVVLDDLLDRKAHISEALKRLPGYGTALGEVVSSGPGFHVNVYGFPPATLTAVAFDTYFQLGKLPASLSDYLNGLIGERQIMRPKSP